jgi:hypothetical protein
MNVYDLMSLPMRCSLLLAFNKQYVASDVPNLSRQVPVSMWPYLTLMYLGNPCHITEVKLQARMCITDG